MVVVGTWVEIMVGNYGLLAVDMNDGDWAWTRWWRVEIRL